MPIKPTQVLEISETIEKIYADCTVQLLANMCAHFKKGKKLSLSEWETEKLSEMGALTNESVSIISRHTKKSKEAVKQAIAEALNIELPEVENILAGAAKKGLIQGVNETWQTSENVKTVIKNLSEQAISDLNVVNTVMLQSTREQYAYAIQFAEAEEQALIEKLQSVSNSAELAERLQATQDILNKSTVNVATGIDSRRQALKKTVKQLAEKGITGFVDAGGKQWSPEAYVNMDIRTTVHNAAVQGQKARSADYGVKTFQISSHGGARPLCAPYQGKIYSWDKGDSGTVYDVYDNAYHYESIYNTSYGQPAGIFGINCGHSPQTFVNGYSIPRYEETTDYEENAREYQLKQQQRYLERQVRQSETEAVCYKSAGFENEYKKSVDAVNSRVAKYEEFCKEQRLTPRMDRTWVLGYNTGTNRKTTQSERKQDTRSNRNLAKPIDSMSIVSEKGKVTYTRQEIVDEMKKSSIGENVLKWIEDSDVKISIHEDEIGNGERGYQEGNQIVIYPKNINSLRVTAQTLIHEMGHYHFNIGNCQHAEAICFGLEKLHLTGNKYLTSEEWEYVKKLAIDNYPEFNWDRGGYGDFSKIQIVDKPIG